MVTMPWAGGDRRQDGRHISRSEEVLTRWLKLKGGSE